MLSIVCGICGDNAKEKHYQLVICVACIAFFRRTISRKKMYVCRGTGNCDVNLESRSDCRSCRIKKCLKQGLNPEKVRTRDLIGPRMFSDPPTYSTDIPDFLQLQHRQWCHHYKHRDHGIRFSATPSDVKFALSTSFKNANEWAMQFKTFRDFSKTERNLVLSEYAIGFMVIDQGWKTAHEAREKEYWLFQNGSYLPVREGETLNRFVASMISSIAKPFQTLRIDRTESVFLKTLLLLASSFPRRVKFRNSEKVKQILNHLMSHTGPERFGEVVLLLGSIRSGIKEFYNQTRRPGILHLNNIESVIRRRLLF